MKVKDYLAGSVPVSELQGRMNEAGQNVKETTTFEDILARAYWTNKPNDAQALDSNLKDVAHVCKLITYRDSDQSLKNANYAVIDGYQCKLRDVPVPHGLGSVKRYSTSYWEVI